MPRPQNLQFGSQLTNSKDDTGNSLWPVSILVHFLFYYTPSPPFQKQNNPCQKRDTRPRGNCGQTSRTIDKRSAYGSTKMRRTIFMTS